MPESSAEIVKFLPYLRRYARALLGSQDRGDEYVRVCLEAYLAEPERIDPSSNIRLELFALFHEVWSLVDETFPEAVPDPTDSKVLQGVGRLPPRQRQVLLLVSLEGFSFDEVSRILNASPGEIRAELEAARAELATQTSVRVLIIDNASTDDSLEVAQQLAALPHDHRRLRGRDAELAEQLQVAIAAPCRNTVQHGGNVRVGRGDECLRSAEREAEQAGMRVVDIWSFLQCAHSRTYRIDCDGRCDAEVAPFRNVGNENQASGCGDRAWTKWMPRPSRATLKRGRRLSEASCAG